MTSKLRGLQLFRQLCRSFDTHHQLVTQPPFGSSPVGQAQHVARAFAAQAAHDLASEEPAAPVQELTPRQLEHQAHRKLLHSLQVALSQANKGKEAVPQSKRGKQERNKILREFAPLQLVLNVVGEEHNEDALRMLEKWERQLRLEWSAAERLHEKYAEDNANLAKLGKGAHTRPANTLMGKWYPQLRAAIEEEQQAVRALKLLHSTVLTSTVYWCCPVVVCCLCVS